jgi:hypothetical protein
MHDILSLMKNTILLILAAAHIIACVSDANKPPQRITADAGQETGTVIQSVAIPGCSMPRPGRMSCSNEPSTCAPCEQEDYICDDMYDAGLNN